MTKHVYCCRPVRRFPERGASFVEYALLLVAVSLMAIHAVTAVGNQLNSKLQQIADGGSMTTMSDHDSGNPLPEETPVPSQRGRRGR